LFFDFECLLTTPRPFGFKDTSFNAAGGEAGIRKLVDDFYDIMSDSPQTSGILAMHSTDLDVTRDKLARFLCGWLGGPRLFREKYGTISITGVHGHLEIGAQERDAWLGCMQQAIARQDYTEDFSVYLLGQLGVPAERIKVFCEKQAATSV